MMVRVVWYTCTPLHIIWVVASTSSPPVGCPKNVGIRVTMIPAITTDAPTYCAHTRSEQRK